MWEKPFVRLFGPSWQRKYVICTSCSGKWLIWGVSWGQLLCWIITIFAISCQGELHSSLWESVWAQEEVAVVNVSYWDSMIGCSSLCSDRLSQEEASRGVIEVSWVNVVYLICFFPLAVQSQVLAVPKLCVVPVWNDSILELTKHEMWGGGSLWSVSVPACHCFAVSFFH